MRFAKNTVTIIISLFILLAPASMITSSVGAVNLFGSADESGAVYNRLNLDQLGLAREVFDRAVKGYSQLVTSGKAEDLGILSIVDFSRPSTDKRLFVIDMENQRLLFNTWVAHGKNTGELYARNFSNQPESNQSSLGFYITGDTYEGKHGLSLQLHGLQPGLNDKALDRAIVIHGADYVSADFIRQTGRLGRSLGCPAVSNELAEPVIEAIRGGTLFFAYHPALD